MPGAIGGHVRLSENRHIFRKLCQVNTVRCWDSTVFTKLFKIDLCFLLLFFYFPILFVLGVLVELFCYEASVGGAWLRSWAHRFTALAALRALLRTQPCRKISLAPWALLRL